MVRINNHHDLNTNVNSSTTNNFIYHMHSQFIQHTTYFYVLSSYTVPFSSNNSMLNRSKLIPTCPAFVHFTQDDGEEIPPPSMDPSTRPSYLNPEPRVAVVAQSFDDDDDNDDSNEPILKPAASIGVVTKQHSTGGDKDKASSTKTSRLSVLTQLSNDDDDDDNAKEKKGGYDLDSSCDDESECSEKIVAIPSAKEKSTSKNWLSRRGAREKAKSDFKKKFAKKMSKKEKKSAKFRAGVSVYTRHHSVADFAPGDVPRKGHRRTKVKEIGTLIKESQYYKDCWVVAFDKGFSATCSIDHLHFHSSTSNTHHYVKGPDNKMILQKIKKTNNEEEAILRVILHSKIHRTVGHSEVTYDYLVSLFKPQFTWLTSSKLRKYVSTSRKLLNINTNISHPKPGTWIANLPVEDVDEHGNVINNTKTQSFSTKRLFNQNSHPRAVIEHKEYYEKFFARSHHDDERSNKNEDQENHGLACTCCGVRFPKVLSSDDLMKMRVNKMVYGRDTMITKTIRCSDGSSTVVLCIVPDRRHSATDPELAASRAYINKLNRHEGIERRIAANGSIISNLKEIEIFDELMDELDAKSKSTNQDDDFVMVGDNDNVAELVKCKDAEGGFIVVDDAAMDKDGSDNGSTTVDDDNDKDDVDSIDDCDDDSDGDSNSRHDDDDDGKDGGSSFGLFDGGNNYDRDGNDGDVHRDDRDDQNSHGSNGQNHSSTYDNTCSPKPKMFSLNSDDGYSGGYDEKTPTPTPVTVERPRGYDEYPEVVAYLESGEYYHCCIHANNL